MQSKNFKAVGARIKNVRKDAGLTQVEFAKAIDSDPSYLSRVESGRQRPSQTMLLAIKERFNVAAGWLLDGDHPYSQHDQISQVLTDQKQPVSHRSFKSRTRNARHTGLLLLGIGKDAPRIQEVFGYGLLSGIKLREKASQDEGIKLTRLEEIVQDDQLWAAAGHPTGWEFELLRSYLDYAGDRSIEQWFEILRGIRWTRECIELAMEEDSE